MLVAAGVVTYSATQSPPTYSVSGAQTQSAQTAAGSITLDLRIPVRASGGFPVRLTATGAGNPNQPAVANLTLTANCLTVAGGGGDDGPGVGAEGGPAINAAVLPPATPGVPYSFTFFASGGSSPYTWSLTGAPTGLSITATGILSGTPAPTSAGAYLLQVTARDTNQATGSYQANLLVSSTIQLTPQGSLPAGVVGSQYSQGIQAAGGTAPYTFALRTTTPAPPGLSFATTGRLTGVPTTAGTYNLTIDVSDAAGNRVSANYSVEIVAPLAIALPNGLPNGQTGTPYTAPIPITGGRAPYTVTATGLPPGTNLAAGSITGTPTTPGTFPVAIRVTDSLGNTATATIPVTISGTGAGLQSTRRSLTFTASVGGSAPAPQSIAVYSGGGTPLEFTVLIDGGTQGTPAPGWLQVSQARGSTPIRIEVAANQGSLGAGNYTSRIRLIPRNAADGTVDIDVTLNVTVDAPKLSAAPGLLRFSARVEAPGILERAIVVQNSGGSGPLAFTAQVVNGSAWVGQISPADGVLQPNAPLFVKGA